MRLVPGEVRPLLALYAILLGLWYQAGGGAVPTQTHAETLTPGGQTMNERGILLKAAVVVSGRIPDLERSQPHIGADAHGSVEWAF